MEILDAADTDANQGTYADTNTDQKTNTNINADHSKIHGCTPKRYADSC
jgi:hypothetical protein